MRIISGRLRGKRIKIPKNINVRPTWKPIHKLHYLKNFHRDDLSVTNYLQYKLFNR